MDLGKLSLPFGILSSLWLYGTSCLFLFPQAGPLTLESNNWLVVVMGGCFVAGLVYWLVEGRIKFKGPNVWELCLRTRITRRLLRSMVTKPLLPQLMSTLWN